MRANMEVRLIHNGREWIAGDANFEARGRTLVELDQSIKNALRKSGKFQQGTKVTVLMKFDYETMPDYARVRQYMPAYFNRVLAVEL
ncbi:Uncharacterized [Moorella glycerini]|uniref:Uncharacterized protein n=1 Tax=Neomoorella stamsii TaxID=1266720 RepID=A0A9X7J5N6_9FIRM|nr:MULTISPECIES: DUF5395 family protein [Moorella]PRR77834.1 hypothetical protein MOST_00280 [Moorella stamsii]CEP68943.1 Uncharacterized [Moorella glycerini]